MFPIIARRLRQATLFVIGLLLVGSVGRVYAQNLAVSKDLCGLTGCISQGVSPSVTPLTLVSYPITLINNGATALNVDLQETFQPGFHFSSSTCGATNPPLPGSGGSTFFGSLALPAMSTTTCIIYGWFEYLPASQNNANNVVTVYASADHQTPLATSNVINATVNGSAPIPTDVALTKTATTTSTDPVSGAVTVHYTIIVSNNGPNDVYGFLLQDRLSVPANSVPLTASYINGSGACTILSGSGILPASTCFGAAPSISNSPLTVSSTALLDFLQWSYPPGATSLLRAGDSMKIEFDVVISALLGLNCVRDPLGNSLLNSAHLSFNVPGSSTTIQDANTLNNTASASVPLSINAPVDPGCGTPALQVTKTQDTIQPMPGGFPWPSTVGYTITLTNHSTSQTIGNIHLFDAINGSLGDLVQAGIGTPPFAAELVGWTCLSSVCSGSQSPAGNTQLLAGYGDSRWMFGTTVYAPPNISDLAPGASVSLQLQIKFRDPGCDSYPEVALKPVLNFVRAAYQDSALGYLVVQSPPVTAYMQAPPACAFAVQKSASANKIVFDTLNSPAPLSYTLSFANPSPQAVTIGTLIDTLRIKQSNYASQLPVDYSYSCAASPAGSVTGFPAAGSGSVTVVNTSLPQQGVRIVQNTGPVIFQAQATLNCNLTLKVHRPSPGDANCARLGELENTAIMDGSAFYNPNLAWPPGSNPGYAASVALPLPQCLNLVVNKSVAPIWAAQNGGPLNYTLSVTNFGAPIVPGDAVTLSDNFAPASYAAAIPWTTSCNPASSGSSPCLFAWSPNPLSNPSTLKVQKLGSLNGPPQSIVTHFPVKRPYPAPPGQLCNHAGANLAGIASEDWYAKDPSTWQTDLCVPIFEVRPLDINKAVNVVPPATTPAVTTFNVNVVCSYIVNGVQYGPSTTVSFTFPPNPGTRTVHNIPVGSVCSIVEQALPTPMAMADCPSGLGAWGPASYPNPPGPGNTTQSVSIVTSTPNRLQVLNTFACLPVGMLSVTKTFDPSSPASQFPATAIYPILVACTGRPNVTVNLGSPNFQQMVLNIPIGSTCSITELPPLGTNLPSTCHWDTSYPKGQSVQIPNGSANLEAHNTLTCDPPLNPLTCAPPPPLSNYNTSGTSANNVPLNLCYENAVHECLYNFAPPGTPGGWNSGCPAAVAGSNCCGWPTPIARGSLSVKKTILYDTMNWTTHQMGDFQVVVSCTNPNSVQTITLTQAGGYQASASNLPVGALCTLAETLPQNPSVLPAGSQWVATYPGGQQATVQAGNQTILLRNERIDNMVPPGKSLLVIDKSLSINGAVDPNHTLSFQLLVSCTDANGSLVGGFPQAVVLQPNLTTYLDANMGLVTYAAQAHFNVPVGSTCTVNEPTLPPLSSNLALCTWAAGTPSYSHQGYGGQLQMGQSMVLAVAQQGYALKVINQLICPPMLVGKPPGDQPTRKLSLKKTSPSEWISGSAGVFNLAVTNSGAAIEPPARLLLSDALPADLKLVAAAGKGWACDSLTPVTCTYKAAVSAGQNLPPVVITAIGGNPGTLANCAKVSLDATRDSVSANDCLNIKIGNARSSGNSSPSATTPTDAPGASGADVGIVTAVSDARWLVDGTGTFSLVLTNHGAALGNGASAEVHGRLAAGLSLQAAEPGSLAWRCEATGNDFRCRHSAPLPTGAQPAILVTVRANRAGTFTNCATVSLSGAKDTNSGNDTSCAVLRVSPNPGKTPVVPPSPSVQNPRQEKAKKPELPNAAGADPSPPARP